VVGVSFSIFVVAFDDDTRCGVRRRLVVAFDDDVRHAVVGPIQTWIVWYFLCSMAFTQLVQKGLNVKMSPT